MSATTKTAVAKSADPGTPALAAYSLNQPEQLSGLAALLSHHIKENKLYSDIQGRKHVNVEGWQFAGAMLGIVPIVEKVEDTSTGQERIFKGYQGKPDTTVYHNEYRATVALQDLRSGQVIGRGIASCCNFESKKRTFDPYAVESMAQTRATGKAFRLLLAWIMQASGYATTPAEEMPDPEPETHATVVEPDYTAEIAAARQQIAAVTSTLDLRDLWGGLPKPVATALLADKDAAKLRIDTQIAAAAGMTADEYLSQPTPVQPHIPTRADMYNDERGG